VLLPSTFDHLYDIIVMVLLEMHTDIVYPRLGDVTKREKRPQRGR